MKPKLMNFWAGKRVSRMSNHSLLLLSLVQDPGCFGSQERFFLKKGTKSCDFGKPVTPSTWGYFKLYLMDFMPQRRQKEIRIWIQPMELERCVLFFVLQIARTNKKPASLQITEHSLLTQNCWVMRGVALFPRVSWGFAKSLLGWLLARSLEWQRQTSPSYQSWTKRTEKTFRKKNRCCPHIYPSKGTTLSEPQLASWWRKQLLGLTL